MSVENTCYTYKIQENRVSERLALFLLFSIPLVIYYVCIYSTLKLFHTDSMTCLIGYQMISLASVYVMSRILKINLKELYFNENYRDFGKNTVIFVAIMLLMFGTSHIFIADPPFFAAGIIGAPALEEVLFRGFLYNFLKNTIKFLPIVFLIDSALFTLAHCAYAGDNQTSIVVFLIGIFSCYLRERYKSLIPCTYLHFLSNLGVFLH